MAGQTKLPLRRAFLRFPTLYFLSRRIGLCSGRVDLWDGRVGAIKKTDSSSVGVRARNGFAGAIAAHHPHIAPAGRGSGVPPERKLVFVSLLSHGHSVPHPCGDPPLQIPGETSKKGSHEVL